MNDYNLTEILEYIDPSTCSYQEWINVGMALKHEGYTVSDWDMWSMKDVNRYHSGECAKKWTTFQGSSAPVTAGTIIQMAKENGYHYENVSAELDWDSEIGSKDELVIVDKNWIERSEIHIPEKWNPAEQIITYLETLFEPDENVGYVTKSWEHDGKFLPSKGCYDRTAGQLIKELYQCKGDIGSVLGDYNSEVGAWIRFNPLDGKGVKNENVTEFRYALVESDTMDISAQKAIITELELPVAALVYSGKKSLHAIVKIDASTYEEYKKRVDYLYNVCNKNGLKLDIQNRNPSRLSRMPGIMRNGKKQYLLDTNIGKENWNEWREWIESVNDDLPDPESMADVWDNLPSLAPPLIDGVLRQGHKMLIAGPSKAGKSYALIELCCAIAEGKKWLEWNCTQGRVMYVIAIIIDPIYKVITGDENSADQMAHFCNQFDKVCTELGCAVIYCHHHSKGAQGGKRSMDRASGSGVFARDPDALIDLVELELNDDILKQEKNKAICKVCEGWLYKYDKLYHASQDDLCSETQMLALCREYLENDAYECVIEDVGKARKTVESRSAWRIEGTLREFPKFAPVNLWFKYPVHNIDNIGVLKDIAVDDGMPTWKKNFAKKKTDAERKTERKNSLETAFEACGIDDKVTVKSMAEYMGVSEKTVRRRLKEHGGFWIDEGQIGKK